LHVPSQSRHSRAGVAELYGAVLLVAVTLSLGYAVYTHIRFPVRRSPVFLVNSHAVYGSPSLLFITVNWSAPSTPVLMSIDEASTSGGILALDGSGYRVVRQLCAASVTTFFSVTTGPGILTVSSDGTVWIDGVEGSTASVYPGMHEILISGASSCTIELPGGTAASYPSPAVSSLPVSYSGGSFLMILVPFDTYGHSLLLIFDTGEANLGF